MTKKSEFNSISMPEWPSFGIPRLTASASTEHFKAIVQSSDDAIISKTLTGIITSWNPGAQALFGYSEQEMLGEPMLKLFPTERIDEEFFILEKIVAGEKVDHFETLRIRKDGSPVNVSVTISPICDQYGRIIGASKIARDITERIRLETTARRFEAIVQSTDDAIIGKSLDGIITSWNPGAEAMFGYIAEEMLGQTLCVLIPFDRPNEEELILEKLRKGEQIAHFETKRICKSGRCIDVSVNISPIRNKNGVVIGASKIARDITEKKANERRLRLLSSVFTNTHEGIVITDASATILEVNEAFSRISGYSPEEVFGRTPEVFASSRHGPELRSSIHNALLQNGYFQGEVWSRRKDGEAYAGLLTVNVVKNRTGQVQNYVALFADITPLRLKQEQLEHLAHFDALTDLPNRILLSDRLHQAMFLSSRHQQSLAVLYLDLDGFKSINDKYGHLVGDELLVAVAQAMRKAMRDIDTIARIGGDEFVAVLVDVKSPYDCSQQVERILRACSDPVIIQDTVLQISASIGVTMYPQDDVDADQLMRHADRAMYEAKQAGKNRYHTFDSSLEIEIRSRSLQLDRIGQALDAREFALYYQPKVNMRTGAVFGVEALIRWHHPERGLLLPAEFLPLIENHSLSESVGQWVLESAFAQLDAWRKIGLNISVSVNIGSRQLQRPNFMSRLAALVEKYPDLNPNDIELEILETSALQDIQAVSSVMRDCRALGVRFAVDDFGTGYSSLTYLRRLPAETLKIDQTFVRDMLEDHEDLAIVQGVIGLASLFGRKVIAEGVETIACGEKLLDLGCELAQGFVISRPMPADQLPEWECRWRPYPSWK